MAVTLILEDGTGVPTANAYLTVAEATSILEVNPVQYATWVGLTPTEQDSYLVWASDYLDVHVAWNGYKAVKDSGLRWPRECVKDADGCPVANNAVPLRVKQATARLAVFLQASESAQTGGESSNIPEGIKRLKADVVELEFFENGSADSQSGSDLLPVNLRYLIQGLGFVNTGRQRFAKLVR